jgi:hypothetical protein
MEHALNSSLNTSLNASQRELLGKVLSGDVHWAEAVQVIQSARKPWHTKEWKEQRQLLLASHCQSCSTTTPPLVLQHTWHPTPLYRLFYNARRKYKKEWLLWKQSHAVEVDTATLVPDADGCPKCGSTTIRYRKTTGTWVCTARAIKPSGQACGHVFNEPLRVLSRRAVRKLEKAAAQKMQDDFDEQFGIGRKVTITALEQQIRYLSLEDTKTLCKRCAFVEDRTRMVLCTICRKNYHSKKYDCCSACAGVEKSVKQEEFSHYAENDRHP